MIAVPVSWQSGNLPLAETSALRKKVNATYLSLSLASGKRQTKVNYSKLDPEKLRQSVKALNESKNLIDSD